MLTQRGDIAVRAADAALLVAYVALEERLPRPLRDYELMLDELNEALEGAREALDVRAEATGLTQGRG